MSEDHAHGRRDGLRLALPTRRDFRPQLRLADVPVEHPTARSLHGKPAHEIAAYAIANAPTSQAQKVVASWAVDLSDRVAKAHCGHRKMAARCYAILDDRACHIGTGNWANSCRVCGCKCSCGQEQACQVRCQPTSGHELRISALPRAARRSFRPVGFGWKSDVSLSPPGGLG